MAVFSISNVEIKGVAACVPLLSMRTGNLP